MPTQLNSVPAQKGPEKPRTVAPRCPCPSPLQLASGDRAHQAARAINPPLRLTQRPCPGPRTPCPCPGHDFSVLLLGQMTMSLTPIHVTGKLGAVRGEGTKPPPSQGSLGGLNERLTRATHSAGQTRRLLPPPPARASTREHEPSPKPFSARVTLVMPGATHTSNRQAWTHGTQSCWKGDTRTGKSQGSATSLEREQNPKRSSCPVPM